MTHPPSRHSLKTRITLATLGVFLASLWTLSLFSTRSLQRDIEKLVSADQLATAGLIAEQLDHELSERLQTLQALAGSIAPHIGKPEQMQRFLDERRDLLAIFDSRLFITDLEGDTLASLPYRSQFIGINFADRDYMAGVLQRGQPTIGQPLIGRTAKVPVVVMAVPVLDADEKVIGALAGSMNLEGPTFLDQMAQRHNGRRGTLTLIDRRNRLIVLSTEPGRTMSELRLEGPQATLTRFLEGDEGTAILRDPQDGDRLIAVRRVPAADWLVLAALPTRKAFAPIRELQRRMLLYTVLLTLVAGGLTWWLLRRHLAPLAETARRLDDLSRQENAPPPLPIGREDEVGLVIAGFNRLLETLRRRETALKQSEAHFRLLTESASDVVWRLDRDFNLTYISPADEKLRGIPPSAVLGRPFWTLAPEDERPLILHAFATLATHAPGSDATTTFACRQTCRNETQLWTEVKASVEFAADGTIAGYHGISRNITERRRMEEQIRQLAFHDTLTGLPNRRLLMDRLQQTIAACRRNGSHGALLFIDLDNFKPLNDRYGHNAGDLLLIEVAARLRSCLRELDSVARFGGDEFVVLIGELGSDRATSLVQVELIADKIRTSLAEPYALTIVHENAPSERIEHQCTASIGITLFDETRDNPDDLLKWADRAMYTAKESGRNRLAFATQ